MERKQYTEHGQQTGLGRERKRMVKGARKEKGKRRRPRERESKDQGYIGMGSRGREANKLVTFRVGVE